MLLISCKIAQTLKFFTFHYKLKNKNKEKTFLQSKFKRKFISIFSAKWDIGVNL